LLTRLEQRGHRLVWLMPDVIGTLIAVRAMVADARTGNLVNGSKAVGEGAVRQWLRKRLPQPIRNLLAYLLDPQHNAAAPLSDQHRSLIAMLEAERCCRFRTRPID
jgi:hypothetical protein